MAADLLRTSLLTLHTEDIYKYLNFFSNITVQLIKCLARGCSRWLFGSLHWLYYHKIPWDEQTCAMAAFYGHFDILSGLEIDFISEEWTINSIESSIRVRRSTEITAAFWDDRACTRAAKGGHLDILIRARSDGCSWGKNTCTAAAEGGHFEILQWARANGCEWDSETFGGAAEFGNIETLQWLCDNGCLWNGYTF
jgi:hypothetical protein